MARTTLRRRRLALAGIVAGATLALAPSALATFPGDNGKIAFIRDGDIWTINQDGSGERRLTQGPAVDRSPEWSPNGRDLYFERDGEVYRMAADGSDPPSRILTGEEPQISSDGRHLAYRLVDQVKAVNLFDFNDEWTIESSDNLSRLDDWAPTHDLVLHTFHDGDSLFAARGRSGALAQWAFLHDDTLHFSNSEPSWSPDGTRIAFATSPAGISTICFGEPVCPHPTVGIRVMDIGGGGLETVQQGLNRRPAWSPDGKRIVYVTNSGQLQITHPDGTGKRTLVRGDEPDWQPLAPKPPEPRVIHIPGPERVVKVPVPVEVTVPGPERVVEKVVTRTVHGSAEECRVPKDRRRFTLVLRAHRTVRDGMGFKVRVDLSEGRRGKATVVKGRKAGLKAGVR